MKILEFLMEVKEIPQWDRAPAIIDEDLDELIHNAIEICCCKDCVYRDGTPGQPNILCGQMKDDDFCSYGEMKS